MQLFYLLPANRPTIHLLDLADLFRHWLYKQQWPHHQIHSLQNVVGPYPHLMEPLANKLQWTQEDFRMGFQALLRILLSRLNHPSHRSRSRSQLLRIAQQVLVRDLYPHLRLIVP